MNWQKKIRKKTIVWVGTRAVSSAPGGCAEQRNGEGGRDSILRWGIFSS